MHSAPSRLDRTRVVTLSRRTAAELGRSAEPRPSEEAPRRPGANASAKIRPAYGDAEDTEEAEEERKRHPDASSSAASSCRLR
jgi:hypothetical protein